MTILKSKPFQYSIAMLFLFVALGTPYLIEDMSTEQQQEITQKMSKSVKEITVVDIFGNNMFIAMLCALPIMGIPFAWRLMYNTGTVIMALQPSFLVLLFNPFVWIEFTAYAYATLQGCYIVYYTLKKRFREAISTGKDIIFSVSILLFVGAIFEILVIRGMI